VIIQNELNIYPEVEIPPEAIAIFLASRENQEVVIANLVVAKISHIEATATGNVITVKLYLKS